MARTAHISAVLVAALIAAGTAERADALSCLRPSVESSFAAAQASSQIYAMAVGRLAVPPGAARPELVNPDEPEGVELPARFSGRMATLGGFDRAIDLAVTASVECAGPWCGGVPEGEVLAFVEQTPDGWRLQLGPCPQWALDVEPDTEARALRCLRDGC